MEITGENLTKFYQHWRMSRKEFAILLGVNYHTLYRWERGERKPSPLGMKAIQKAIRDLEDEI